MKIQIWNKHFHIGEITHDITLMESGSDVSHNNNENMNSEEYGLLHHLIHVFTAVT